MVGPWPLAPHHDHYNIYTSYTSSAPGSKLGHYIEPISIKEACKYENWVRAMNEELNRIEKNQTWELVPRPKNKNFIGTKWVFKNTVNEDGQVIRNKAILVCKEYAQVEGVDFEETFNCTCGHIRGN